MAWRLPYLSFPHWTTHTKVPRRPASCMEWHPPPIASPTHSGKVRLFHQTPANPLLVFPKFMLACSCECDWKFWYPWHPSEHFIILTYWDSAMSELITWRVRILMLFWASLHLSKFLCTSTFALGEAITCILWTLLSCKGSYSPLGYARLEVYQQFLVWESF